MITTIRHVARALGERAGWRRNMMAFLFGVCATLALPPFFVFPMLIPAFTGLFWLVTAAPSHKRAFWDGWWWGWGFYMTGLYWFCIALLTDAEKFAWLIPFALFGLTGVIALYSAVACWVFSCLRLRGVTRLLVFPVLWVIIEYARGHLFTGFPWNLSGYSFAFSNASLQLASQIGAYGLTWFAVLIGVIFAALGDVSIPLKRSVSAIAAVALLFAAAFTWGEMRLQASSKENYVDGVTLRLVQANIEQPHKWDPKLQAEGLHEYIELTETPGLDKVTHVIWPETAAPYVLKAHSELTRLLGNTVLAGKYLLTGVLRAEGEDRNWRIWNSLMMLDHEGEIVGSYDKSKLVPFGEFLPFRSFLPASWLTPVGDTDFSSGKGPQTLHWPSLPSLSPLICYEAVFPELAVSPQEKPRWLLSVTNDAWFGKSSGPYQHFQMARTRAVEQGLPLIRVANTGITAVIDPYGRILRQLALGEKGVIDSKIPSAITLDTTYNTYGNEFLLLLVLIAGILIFRQRITSKV